MEESAPAARALTEAIRTGDAGRTANGGDVTGVAAYLRHFFTSVRVAATLSNPDGLHNQEWGGHVYLCTGPREPWSQLWPHLRHYD